MSKIYVGTYRKYNEGSLKGDWLDLTDYDSKAEFMEACAKLHSDESDPELMFQDWEDIPDRFIGESHIDEKTWEWLELSEDEREIVALYIAEIDFNVAIETALECYEGEHESAEDWARDFWEHTGMVNEIPEQLQNYIDYEQFARDCRLGGDMVFVEKGHSVRAFRRN
jgi:antirestriction protein